MKPANKCTKIVTGARNQFVKFYFSSDDNVSAKSEAQMCFMLRRQLRRNDSIKYIACAVENRIDIYDSNTWEVIQVINDEDYSESLFIYFVGQFNILVGLKGRLKIWNVHQSQFTKLIHADIGLHMLNFVTNDCLVLYENTHLVVVNTTTEQINEKTFEERIDHVCVIDDKLVTLDDQRITFWKLSTFEKLKEIKLREKAKFVSGWFGEKLVVSSFSTSRILDLQTQETEKKELPCVILYTTKYRNRIISAGISPNDILLWDDKLNFVSYPGKFENYWYHNPFKILGSLLVFLELKEDDEKCGNDIQIFEIETGKFVREIKGEFTKVATWESK